MIKWRINYMSADGLSLVEDWATPDPPHTYIVRPYLMGRHVARIDSQTPLSDLPSLLAGATSYRTRIYKFCNMVGDRGGDLVVMTYKEAEDK